MKRCYLFLTILVSLVAASALQGCKKDPATNDTPDVKIELGTVGTNSAELKVTAGAAGDYAYMVDDGQATPPLAVVLFAEGETGKLASGQNTMTILDLEAETNYVVYFAARFGDYITPVMTVSGIKTGKYTDFVTVIQTSDFTSIKYHVEVPKDKTIGVGILPTDTWYGMKTQFGYVDAEFVNNPNGTIIVNKTGTYTFDGWNDVDPETGETVKTTFVPGFPLTLVAAEMEYGTNMYGEEGWMPKFDFEAYNASGGGGEPAPLSGNLHGSELEDPFWTTEFHTTQHFTPRPPLTLDAHVTVKVVSSTTRTLTVELTPDPEIETYGYLPIPVSEYVTQENVFGKLGVITQFATQMVFTADPQKIQITDLVKDLEYVLILIGHGNTEGSLRSVDYYEFTAKEATKAAPKVKVTGIKNPDGEDSPWQVWFNLKCTSKDAITAKYLCNDTEEWKEMLGTGITNDQMIQSFGVKLTEAEVGQINSDEGLNMMFNAWEDSNTRFALSAFNDEETGSSVDGDQNCWADNATIEILPLTPVSSQLFTQLLGDWTASAHMYTGVYNQETGEFQGWELSKTPLQKKVAIGNTVDYPSTCPQEAYTIYAELGYSKEETDEFYTQFAESATKHLRKVEGQNQLVCHGFDFADYGVTAYKSAWDLFMDSSHNSYTTDDLFFDYGPKWFLQIEEGDKVFAPIDITKVAPLMISYGAQYRLIGSSDDSYAVDIQKLNVEISADKQTITVKPYEKDGVTYYPTIATIDAYGYANIYGRMHDLVLTKGWTGGNEPSAMSSKFNRNNTKTTSLAPNGKVKSLTQASHKTRISKAKYKNYKPLKTIEVKPVSMTELRDAKLKALDARRTARK